MTLESNKPWIAVMLVSIVSSLPSAAVSRLFCANYWKILVTELPGADDLVLEPASHGDVVRIDAYLVVGDLAF